MNPLVQIYLFFLPFQSVIIYSNDSIEINLPTLVGAILTPFFTVSNKIRLPSSFKYLIILVLWFLTTNLLRFGLDNYILSIFQLLTAIIPSISILTNYKEDTLRRSLIIILKFQLLLFIPLIARDYGLFNFNFLDILFQEVHYSTRSDYFGIERSRATFYEPSYFGIYLTLIYFIFRILKLNFFWRFLILIQILTTFSFGCFVLIFLVYLYIFIKKISIKVFVTTITLLIVFSIIAIKTDFGNKFYSIIEERVIISYQAITLGILTGSEGARINSLPVALIFASENATNLIFGEGFSTDRIWLKNHFAHIPFNQFGEGHIFNTFAAIVFHGGVTALFLYIIFLRKLLKEFRISVEYSLTIIYLHFYYSGLQSYFLWIAIFLFINIADPIYHKIQRNEKKHDKGFIFNSE